MKNSEAVKLFLQKKEKSTSTITRDELWCKGHTRKDGKPPNSIAAECIVRISSNIQYQKLLLLLK